MDAQLQQYYQPECSSATIHFTCDANVTQACNTPLKFGLLPLEHVGNRA